MPRDRVVLARALRPAGIGVIAGLSAALVAAACVPAGIALTLGAIVSALNRHHGQALFSAALLPLAAFGVVIFAGHLADAIVMPLEFRARARIEGTHRTRLLRMITAVSSIGPLETASVQQLIRQASAEPDHGVTTPADGALAQVRWIAGLIGTGAVCGVLTQYAWWLVPLLVVPAGIGLYLRSSQFFAAVEALRVATKEELHADVWRDAASSSAEGKDVRIFGFADWMIERMQHHIAVGNMPFWAQMTRVARQSWAQFGLVLAGLVPAYVVVTLSAAAGHTTVATQTAILIAAWSVFRAVGSSEMIYKMAGSVAVLRATSELSEALRPWRDTAPGLGAAGPGAPPCVRFERVCFSYPGTRAPVLDQLDLEIRPGELLAIVGLNGAGKSTMIKLLAGLYQPDDGRITADGVDITSYGWTAWRSRISTVFQDFVRYELPVLDNIVLGYASSPPDVAAARAAADEAGLGNVLRQLPDGWGTALSRRRAGGVDLSGGQWQQVVLARSLYAVRMGATLLVLDEPTAHLDVRTEFEVFERLADHRGDTTVVLISHRLSTVRKADRIVLLDGGRITESGSHDELMVLGGTYAKLFALQAERFQAGDDLIDEDAL